MTMVDWQPAAGFIGAVLVAVIGARMTRAGAREGAFIDQLQEEMATLRTEVASLRTDVAAALAEVARMRAEVGTMERVLQAACLFIDAIGYWLTSGQRGQSPAPSPLLRDHVDMSHWTD